jgi:hypothetical protein
MRKKEQSWYEPRPDTPENRAAGLTYLRGLEQHFSFHPKYAPMPCYLVSVRRELTNDTVLLMMQANDIRYDAFIVAGYFGGPPRAHQVNRYRREVSFVDVWQ